MTTGKSFGKWSPTISDRVRYGIRARKQRVDESDGGEREGCIKSRHVQRLPSTHIGAQMDSDVVEYVFGDPQFSEVSEDDLADVGYARCVDHPDIPGHVYYEGYFHGLDTPSPVRSVNPRTKKVMDKPAAPPRLRAFLKAFRALNVDWMDNVANASPQLSKLYRAGFFFSDLAIQIHFGDAVPPERVGWHLDSPNSVIHLALGLHGDRALHTSTLSEREHELGMDCDTVTQSTLTVYEQPHGAAYLSSPYAFQHAVQYPQCCWKDRVVAVQSRLLFSSWGFDTDAQRSNGVSDMSSARAARVESARNENSIAAEPRGLVFKEFIDECNEDGVAIMERVTSALLSAKLKLPTLEQVKTAQVTLAAASES